MCVALARVLLLVCLLFVRLQHTSSSHVCVPRPLWTKRTDYHGCPAGTHWGDPVSRARPDKSATTLTFVMDGVNTVSSFVMRSQVPWNMAVPPDDTTLAVLLLVSTSHFMKLETSVVESAGFFTGGNLAGTTLLRNGNVRRDSDDVTVWENLGLLLGSRWQ